MNLFNQLSQIGKNLSELGQGRLLALGAVGAVAIAVIIAAGLFLNKPSTESLYIGLTGDDINQIGIALSEAQINYTVGADGTSVLVPAGTALQARAILAERGLPNSSSAGYELFDNVGSLGLTSFMQEVTRVRALEGEIARTIQKINGINAARVHIVMADSGNFRSGERKPSASVMVKTGNSVARRSADSIRHLVASSVPGLTVDEVTVLDSTGKLLAAGDDFSNSNINRSMSIVQMLQNEIENNIDKALSPFLGLDNFRSSVTAKVNTDTQQIQETVFDPESRVERSTRITRDNQSSSQTSSDAPATVEQNIPDQATAAGANTPQSKELAERKEEQTNYEINSKVIQTVRNSYEIEKLSIAVVVNDTRVKAMLGEGATDEQVAAYIAELQQVVTTAAGLDADRGDIVKLTTMEFLAEEILADGPATSGFMEMLTAQLGTIINAISFIVVAFLIVWFGIKPILNTGGTGSDAAAGGDALDSLGDVDGLELPDFSPGIGGDLGAPGASMEGFGADFGFDADEAFGGGGGDDGVVIEEGMGFTGRVKGGPEKRLSSMVEISEERAAKVLRKWAIGDAA
ncbi:MULTISPECIES: flagellar basal-body MS-ring/collar protein FliF [unclassified Lentilitoribacter]|jgi:flagellar M-ring protein FliF|uniref:flagellar basal-body MS-ring/collar protein FliF n=1 Tax=unclassified Lentilitoribacter TaxID=2647570 RepID=UPI0013A6E5B8|nr:flagellar basal-body MS-ring/collar protein FliF [Lentilitoribacter sp. Alg239-R112]